MIYKKHTLCGFAVIIVLLLISIVLCFNVGRNRDDSFRQWSDIRKDSVINIGVLQNPVEYYVVRGKISGFSYELTSAMSEFLNLKPVYHIFANIEDAYMSVINGKIDILAAAEVRDVEMSALLDYTSAFWKTDIVLVQNKKSPVFSNKNCDSLVRDLPFSIGVTLPVSFYENAAVLLEKYPKNCSVRYYKFLPGFLLQEVEDNLLDRKSVV